MSHKSTVASILTDRGLALFIDGDQYVVANDHPNLPKILDALRDKAYHLITDLVDLRSAVKAFISKGKDFALTNDLIHLHGVAFSAAVTDKVLSMIDAGSDAEPLFAFLRNVRLNPSKTSQDELLLFCVANGFMISDDGYVLAYKSVRGDYTDIHTGKFRNAVGDHPEMDRGQVDDNRENTCSDGLHFAAFDYASTWSGAIDGVHRRLMVMKIHPKDVVSIPNDYDNQKGRCATYEIIAELLDGKPLPKQEVYTDAAARGKPEPVVSTPNSASESERLEKFEAEIARKSRILTRWIEEYTNVAGKLDQARRNKKAWRPLAAILDILNGKMSRINEELDVLYEDREMLLDDIDGE